jgi:hypothetical protein
MASIQFAGIQVTLSGTPETKESLLELLQAVEPGVPGMVRECMIQSDQANAAAIVSIGDAKLATDRYGYQLQTGESNAFRSNLQNVPLASIYVMSSVAGSKLNVTLMVA